MRMLMAALILLFILFLVLCAMASPSPPPVTMVDTYEQALSRDQADELVWRFARYDQPLAATLRVYADGLRLVQGDDYRLVKDDVGWYIRIKPRMFKPRDVVADFKE